MKRSRKKYERPKRPWDKKRIEKEIGLLKTYGLRKKQEVWRSEGLLRKYKRLARELAAKKDKERERMVIKKLVKMGLLNENASLDDVLSLTLENLLDRRLQTILLKKGLVNTTKQARQLITHGHVVIDNRKVTYPSYLVNRTEEEKIELKFIPKNLKKVETI